MLIENIKIALQSIYSNKMRSLLTMLGIIIGISSVIAIVSIGDSMKGAMNSEYEQIGTGRLFIYPSYELDDIRQSDYFYSEDIKNLQNRFSKELKYISTNDSLRGEVTRGKKTISVSLNCVAEGYDKVQNVELLYGRWITQRDVERKAMCTVIQDKMAQTIFNKTNVVGETLRVKDNYGETQDFLIVGVYREEISAFLSMMNGPDRYFYGIIPYSVILTDYAPTYALDVFVSDNVSVEEVAPKILNLISSIKKRNPEDYVIYTVKEDMQQVNSILTGLSLAVGAIAAISLLVGGIGIMNIMLVSVTERTREIGIKKALGARTRDVLSQFLIESAVLSAMGGIVGTLLGIGLVSLGGLFIPIPIVLNPTSIMIAVAFSTIIGVFFGYYPAKKAAKADPIDSLRYE